MFTKPWQNPCPYFEESQNLYIKYPADDESHGMVTVAWRGPSAVKELYDLGACIVLMIYLTDSSIAPLQKQFVEIADPYASEVNLICCKNSGNLELNFLGILWFARKFGIVLICVF